jgi:hypothetical protein
MGIIGINQSFRRIRRIIIKQKINKIKIGRVQRVWEVCLGENTHCPTTLL